MITTFANVDAPIMTTGDFVFKTDAERFGTKNSVDVCVGLKSTENVRQVLSMIRSTAASKYPAVKSHFKQTLSIAASTNPAVIRPCILNNVRL